MFTNVLLMLMFAKPFEDVKCYISGTYYGNDFKNDNSPNMLTVYRRFSLNILQEVWPLPPTHSLALWVVISNQIYVKVCICSGSLAFSFVAWITKNAIYRLRPFVAKLSLDCCNFLKCTVQIVTEKQLLTLWVSAFHVWETSVLNLTGYTSECKICLSILNTSLRLS